MNPNVDRGSIALRLIAQLKRNGPDCLSSDRVVPASEYSDPDRFATECDVVFRKGPVFLAYSAEIPNVGDVKTLDVAGTPLLIVRSDDGVVRGFRNACIHRGAALVHEPCAHVERRIVCPYHGWSYSTRGELVGVPFKEGFPNADAQGKHLPAIQVDEKCGLIFGVIDSPQGFSLSEHLAGLEQELAGYNFQNWRLTSYKAEVIKTNWKFAMDTFTESYHFAVLHKDTLPVVVSNRGDCQPYGNNMRQVFALKTMQNLIDETPESIARKANFAEYMQCTYYLYPNILIACGEQCVQSWQILPGAHAGETVIYCKKLFAPGMDPEAATQMHNFFDFNWEHVVQAQDMVMAATQYKACESKSLKTVIFGRNEILLQHWHEQLDAALAGAATR